MKRKHDGFIAHPPQGLRSSLLNEFEAFLEVSLFSPIEGESESRTIGHNSCLPWFSLEIAISMWNRLIGE